MADRCRVCTTPLAPGIGPVCLVCRPAYDAGRRSGMEYCIEVLRQRGGPDGQVVVALRAAMPSSRRQPVDQPMPAPTSKPRRKPHLRAVQLLPTAAATATPPDPLRALLAETPTACHHCQKVAHVTGEERLRGRWTCYACGLVNEVVAR